jgi:predicted porin
MTLKKNLVAAAALMAVAAVAQADVKLYGTLDVGVGSIETAHAKGTSVRKTTVDSGNMMTSFFGLAGSEDLGGGLKAEFALESFLAVDNGTNVSNNMGGWWGRASNVALSKDGMGKVAIGQYDNPLFTSGYLYNPFGSSMTFSPTMRHLSYIGQTSGSITSAGVGFDTGWVNSLTYESPVVAGGLQAIFQYAPKESTTSGTGNNYTAAVSYNAGPLSAMVTYVKGGVSDTAKTTTASGTLFGYTADEKVFDIGASYDFGVAKAFAQFTSIKETANALKSTVDNKDKIYQIGVSVPVNEKATVMASYGELKNTVSATSTKKSDKIFSVGYDYVLSKRTDVYGAFMTNSQTDLESGQSVAVGIKHAF